LKTAKNSRTVLKAATSAQKADKASDTPREKSTEEGDKKLLLRQMAMALCRQYIMWPTSGPLPCQKGIDCTKSASCNEMAEDVVDYAGSFPKD